MTTLLDLTFQADSSQLDKAQDTLKRTGEEAKKTVPELKKVETGLIDLEKASKKVGGSMEEVAQSFNPVKAATGLLAGAIAALSLGSLKEMVGGVIEGAASLEKLSAQTGLTVEELSVMKQVAAQSGTSMDSVTGAVIKFEKSLAAAGRETSLQSKAFKELGINTSDTSKTTEQYMAMAAEKLNTLQDGWEKNNIVMALFGKSGTEVNKFLELYAEKGDMAAKITAEQAAQAEHYERTMAKLSNTSNQYKQLIGMALLPVLSSIADEFLKMVQTTGKLDDETKKLIANEVQSWAFGIAKGLAAGIDVGIAFWHLLEGLGQALGALGGSVATFGDAMGKVLHGDFSGAWESVKANASQLKSALSDAWKTASQDSSKYFDLVTKAQAEMGKKVEEHAKEPKRKASNIGDQDTKDKTPDLEGEIKALQKKLLLQGQLYEADALRKMIDAGYYTKYDQAQVKQLLHFQEEIDKQERVNTVKKIGLEIEKQMQDVAANDKSARVMMQYGKTTTDAAIAVNKYRIEMAKAELQSAQNAGATRKEIDALQDKIKVMEGEANTLVKSKELETARTQEQRSFSYGWSQAFSKFKDDATNNAKFVQDAFSGVTGKMTDALTTFVTTGKLNFKDFTASILADLAKIAMEKAVAGIAAAMFADGGAFSNGTQVFADGGVVSSPTSFGMSGGRVGLMGEAGPEAIMPLARGSDGKLGVRGAGGGQTSVNNTYNMTVSIGSVDSNDRKAELLRDMQNMVVSVTKQTMADQMRQGGMLNRRSA